jgi:uncharacterized protein with PIN domain
VIIDTSAILFAEPEADHFSAEILAAETPRVPVASYLEASLRLAGRGAPLLFKGDDFSRTDILAAT